MPGVSAGVHPNAKVLIHPIHPFSQHKSGIVRMPIATIDVWDRLKDLLGHIP